MQAYIAWSGVSISMIASFRTSPPPPNPTHTHRLLWVCDHPASLINLLPDVYLQVNAAIITLEVLYILVPLSLINVLPEVYE